MQMSPNNINEADYQIDNKPMFCPKCGKGHLYVRSIPKEDIELHVKTIEYHLFYQRLAELWVICDICNEEYPIVMNSNIFKINREKIFLLQYNTSLSAPSKGKI